MPTISRVFANGLGDQGSIPGQVIPKTKKKKKVLDATLLNMQHYKVRIKGKVEQSRKWSSALPYTMLPNLLLVLKEKIHKHVSTAKTINILFHEQAVFRRNTK